MMLKQTKIVASISDQRCEVEFIRDLFKAGMNVVRMNTAHALLYLIPVLCMIFRWMAIF